MHPSGPQPVDDDDSVSLPVSATVVVSLDVEVEVESLELPVDTEEVVDEEPELVESGIVIVDVPGSSCTHDPRRSKGASAANR